jgi:hypothetical protein
MKRFVVFLFAITLVSLSQAFAAVKPCEELKAEIAAKLAAKGLMGYQLKISEKGGAATGKVVGSCEDGSRKISYVRSTTPPPQQVVKVAQEPPVKKIEIAATQPAAPSEEQVPVVAVQMIQVESKPTAAIKSCEQLQAEIAAKLDSKGLKGGYELTVSAHDGTEGKVVGTCENGSKKIIYLKK